MRKVLSPIGLMFLLMSYEVKTPIYLQLERTAQKGSR